MGVSSASWLDRMPPLISLAVVLARAIMLFEADRGNVPAFHQSAPISASHSADISQLHCLQSEEQLEIATATEPHTPGKCPCAG